MTGQLDKSNRPVYGLFPFIEIYKLFVAGADIFDDVATRTVALTGCIQDLLFDRSTDARGPDSCFIAPS